MTSTHRPRALAPAAGGVLLVLLGLAVGCVTDRGEATRKRRPAEDPPAPVLASPSAPPSESAPDITPGGSEVATPSDPAAKQTGARPPTARDEERPTPSRSDPLPAPRPWEGAASLTSNAGTYRVLYRTTPTAIPRGEHFAIEAWVFSPAAPDRPLADVRLSADAAMPEHGHGMNRVPRIEELADGGFRVEGMYFHMPGLWQLYLDVTRGALTERAQLDVELE